MGAARNLLNDWCEGKDLDDLEDFVPMNPSTIRPDMLPETVMRRSNRKRIDKSRAAKRESKEKLIAADEREKASA